jgi:hypothetical protein
LERLWRIFGGFNGREECVLLDVGGRRKKEER